MGFLNFIKKTKKKEDFSFPSNLDLDIPPPPPTVKSAAKVEKELPSFSAKKVELPKKPIEIPKPEIRPVPKFVEKFEKKAFKEEKEELHTVERKPVFIDVEDYRGIISNLMLTKGNIKEATSSLARVEDINEAQDKELEMWQKIYKDLQRKLIFVDKTLFRG